MTPSRCPVCGGDSWDNHAGCNEEPPRDSRTAPKKATHPHDTTDNTTMQDGPARAWEEFDAR